MKYLLLIYGNEELFGKMTEAEQQSIMQEYNDFTKSIAQSGYLLGGNELQPVANATTVRVRNKKRSVTDGPFAETKEQLGGYYLIEAKDLDDAIAVAARIPSARWGRSKFEASFLTRCPEEEPSLAASMKTDESMVTAHARSLHQRQRFRFLAHQRKIPNTCRSSRKRLPYLDRKESSQVLS